MSLTSLTSLSSLLFCVLSPTNLLCSTMTQNDPNDTQTTVVIGGGAAGFFGAIACAEAHPEQRVILLEKAKQWLSKVRISGGGRCNVTHACFDPAHLVRHYPRGDKALRGPFTRFQPLDTIAWFESRGVALKVENDGRMFPTTDNSETIIQCLLQSAQKAKVELRQGCGVKEITPGFELLLSTGEELHCDRILLATGSQPAGLALAEQLGHTIQPLVPSLFTCNIPDSPLSDLAGISVNGRIGIGGTSFVQEGPILITHWGFSGPAVLRLSAWAARLFHEKSYEAEIWIEWSSPQWDDIKRIHGTKLLKNFGPEGLPKSLWQRFLLLENIDGELRWAGISKEQLSKLSRRLQRDTYLMSGKTTYKQEFVTCGGITLDEVDFRTMQSRLCPGLFFAGEVLDIDGITGGFNFQNAWTTGWIAGQSMGSNG